jgi:large subunit ribosomal protein L29
VKTKEIRDQSNEQLAKSEHELEDQLFKLRFQMATNQTENPGRIRLARKDLARVKTVRSERRIAAAAPARAGKGAAAPGKE